MTKCGSIEKFIAKNPIGQKLGQDGNFYWFYYFMGLWNVIFHNTFLNGINQNNYNSNSIPKRFEMNAENTLGDKRNGRWSMEEH